MTITIMNGGGSAHFTPHGAVVMISSPEGYVETFSLSALLQAVPKEVWMKAKETVRRDAYIRHNAGSGHSYEQYLENRALVTSGKVDLSNPLGRNLVREHSDVAEENQLAEVFDKYGQKYEEEQKLYSKPGKNSSRGNFYVSTADFSAGMIRNFNAVSSGVVAIDSTTNTAVGTPEMERMWSRLTHNTPSVALRDDDVGLTVDDVVLTSDTGGESESL